MTDASAESGALSRYRLLRRLGSGGMGEVYLADDGRLGRQVALKILPAEACSDPQLRLRFKQEARTAAMLSHPNICTVYDVDEGPDGRIFITMEYVEGGTVSEKATGRALPLEEVLDIAIQAGEAIEEAHQKGVIHRDLKPGNMMLTPRGRLKVVDFGLAKMSAASGDEQSPTGLRTSPGMVMGTVAYMSPEQAFAHEVDHRSDIFSFGVVLYQLAGGERPFSGRSEMEIIDRIAHHEPPPLDRGSVPEPLERVIRKCLEKDREHRYQSMTDLLVDLRAIQRASRSTPAVIPKEERVSTLPPQVTSFIGRTRELEELRSLLEQHRLVTITGAAGCGKSRLALQAAAERTKLTGGVFYADLGAIDDRSRVAATVAAGLGGDEDSSSPDALARKLGRGEALLVIDNSEHVVDAVATLAGELLRGAPGLRLLCTSREALSVAGECSWSLAPLTLPQPNVRLSLANAMVFDSIVLFDERARAAQPRFELTESNLPSVVSICRAVDGIPLAIELAAARVRAMSPAEIAKRLDDAFRLLAGQTRGAQPRQQTLRAAVDWSYELLSADEKQLFQRLSVFRGGFDLDAAEGVVSFGSTDRADVLDLLTRLVEKSLVLADQGGDFMRYRLLEPLRQYALEKLSAAGDAADARRLHCEHFTALAERAYAERVRASGLWLERLEREHDNFRAALDLASASDPARELQLAGALGWFWYSHSHLREGRDHLRAALEKASKRDRDTARALWGLSMLGYLQSDRESRNAAERSLALWREIGDDAEAALALEAIGWSHWLGEQDNDAALARFEEALAIHQRAGDERLTNRARLAVCQVLVSQGNIERAEPLTNQALALAISHGDERDIHSGYHFLADCALIEEDFLKAEGLYRTSLRWALAYGDRVEATYEVEGVAMALAGQERHEEALRLSGAALAERDALSMDGHVRFWDELVARYIGAADRSLGAEAARLRAEGARMGFEAACDQALSGKSA